MNLSFIIFLTLLGLFLITFVIELIVVVFLSIKTGKLKKHVLGSGYNPSTVSGAILPANEQMQNFKSSFGYSLFSFDYHLISNFGKDILAQVNNENYKTEIESLRKIHRAYIRLLFLGFTFLILSIGSFFLVRM